MTALAGVAFVAGRPRRLEPAARRTGRGNCSSSAASPGSSSRRSGRRTTRCCTRAATPSAAIPIAFAPPARRALSGRAPDEPARARLRPRPASRVAILAGLLPTFFEGEFELRLYRLPAEPRSSSRTASSVYDALQAAFAVVGIVFFLGVVVLAVRRWRAATPAMRRVLRPVYLTGGVSVAAIGVRLRGSGFASEAAGDDPLDRRAASASSLLPFALPRRPAADEPHARRAPPARLRRTTPTSEGAQDAISKALGDPTARLGLWIEQEHGYVGSAGQLLPAAHGRAGVARTRASTPTAGRSASSSTTPPSTSTRPSSSSEVSPPAASRWRRTAAARRSGAARPACARCSTRCPT